MMSAVSYIYAYSRTFLLRRFDWARPLIRLPTLRNGFSGACAFARPFTVAHEDKDTVAQEDEDRCHVLVKAVFECNMLIYINSKKMFC